MANHVSLRLTVEKTDTGYSAFAGDYPIFTTGKTFPDLIINAYEASDLCFEDEEGSNKYHDISFQVEYL
ncbi:hypothetical protein [Litoribacter populi]|uniref:hypothetical protein n=1 Tax=Litoribacter populi TaxID=2598460 RepID=UPI001180A9B5|nr:hypothetical protein [Litoribacter populi]